MKTLFTPLEEQKKTQEIEKSGTYVKPSATPKGESKMKKKGKKKKKRAGGRERENSAY